MARGMFEEKIGEGLLRIGAMSKTQVDDVLLRQQGGDKRMFGEIAVDLAYVDTAALVRYLQQGGG
jgi:hypothetical protein